MHSHLKEGTAWNLIAQPMNKKQAKHPKGPLQGLTCSPAKPFLPSVASQPLWTARSKFSSTVYILVLLLRATFFISRSRCCDLKWTVRYCCATIWRSFSRHMFKECKFSNPALMAFELFFYNGNSRLFWSFSSLVRLTKSNSYRCVFRRKGKNYIKPV